MHEDHLGSTDVITNAAGTVVVRQSFDAWGQRRGSNWSGVPSAADKVAISATTHQGFTGHEQLDNLNLVHMNGRVYDPVIARFMSADPIIQDPYHSQSFNRYTYVWNNPLNATDPTGYCKVTGSHIEVDKCIDWSTGAELDAKNDVGSNGQQEGATARQPVVEAGRNSAQVSAESRDTGRSAKSNAADEYGPSANRSNSHGRYSLDAPRELEQLRRDHPELVEHERALWERSQARGKSFFSFDSEPAREHALVVYQNIKTGKLVFDTHYKAEYKSEHGMYDRITNWPQPPERLPVPAGHTLILSEHTHPFPFQLCQPNCVGDTYERGPSGRDFEVARDYPEAFHVIHGAGLRSMFGSQGPSEYIYYGERAGVP